MKVIEIKKKIKYNEFNYLCQKFYIRNVIILNYG